ncbi:MAG: ATP synthase subunit I [Gammaproteobacteria bacterium]|nr:ATP synthase subunit I [Gammaproteobacteria bacterium]MBU2478766.1 ATP synthase subunit I [Gammaproteobacteria bacterium]
MRKILNIQVVIAVLAALSGYFYGGMPVALAALFGAGIALSNTLLLAWRLHRSKRQIHADAHRHLRSFYFSTVERFFVVGGLLAVGLGALQLMPLPLLAAFVAGQIAWMISGLTSGNT